MASDVDRHAGSANTSGDSKGSGRQKSMLELLSITDAAVKALNKSTRSLSSNSSHASGKSHHTDRSVHSKHSDQSVQSQHSDHLSEHSKKSDHSALSKHSAVSAQSRQSGKSDGSHQSQPSLHSNHSNKSGQSRHSGESAGSHSDRSKGSGSRQAVVHKGQQLPVLDNSSDSGVISKTHTLSEDKSKKSGPVKGPSPSVVHDSDESTTASEVLVRSTLVDKSERSVTGMNSSVTSKCSKTSYGAENFNTSGPQKVKVSKKYLREIKSPYDDDSPRDTGSGSGDSKVPSALLNGHGNHSDKESIDGAGDRDSRKSSVSKISSSSTAGSGSIGVSKTLTQFGIEKVKKTEMKVGENVNMMEKKLPQVQVIKEIPVQTRKESVAPETKKAEAKIPHTSQLRSTPKYYVERHTPQKAAKHDGPVSTHAFPERKNLLQELEDSVEAFPQRNDSILSLLTVDSSTSSSQPEVVTVPERIVTVSARNSVSPSSSITDFGLKSMPPVHHGKPISPMTEKHVTCTIHNANSLPEQQKPPLPKRQFSDDDLKKPNHGAPGTSGISTAHEDSFLDSSSNSIPPALKPRDLDDVPPGKTEGDNGKIPARFQLYSKATGAGLKQGAPVTGADALESKKQTDDVQISQYRLTDKQKLVKESLAKRNKDNGPVRRVVQPKIVGHDPKPSSTSSNEDGRSKQAVNQSNEVLTAAAAASAAVAATQPFLKAQYEMEARMKEILEKVSVLQEKGIQMSTPPTESDRITELQNQLSELTEKRIDYIEKLQQQQIAMQARFMSVTREMPSSRTHTRVSPSHSPESRYRKQLSSSPHAKKAFSKTTVHQGREGYVEKKQSYNLRDMEDSVSALDTPAPRSRAPKPTTYDTSDIELRSKPRSRSRSPGKTEQSRGILHQILATDPQDSYRQRSTVVEQSPAVSKAKHLVEELATLKDQMKGIVSNAEQLKKTTSHASQPQGPSRLNESVASSNIDESPLDPYLIQPGKDPVSPYKSVPNLSHSQINAPVLSGFKDAEGILRQVQKNRNFLEANLEAVLRTKHEAEVYTLLEALYQDSSNKENARIQQKVDGYISKLQREVQREVTDDLVIAEVNKQHPTKVPGAVKMPAPAPTKPVGRGVTRRGLAEPKVDIGARKTGYKPGVPAKVPGKATISQRARPPTKKARSVFEDEEYMTRVYGKASYQKGRTTVKDPYLHMKNVPKHKISRPQGIVGTKGVEMMSSKTQTGGQTVKQFYFNPASGTYIPVASAATAPIPGQLIPMAVPLGGPRMDPGITIPVSKTAQPSSGGVHSGQIPQVTAAGNVAMVSIPSEEDTETKPSPELGKQVLPPVDIDTDMSVSVSEVEDRRPSKKVQIQSPERSPNKSHYEVTFHDDREDMIEPELDEEVAVVTVRKDSRMSVKSQHAVTEEEKDEPSVKHEHSDEESYMDGDADERTATGMVFPGYQPSETRNQEYHGPQFPPAGPSADRQLTSDLIAEDIRRRDMLQNKVTDWVEQELMARIITEVYPLRDHEELADLSHVVSEMSEDSAADDRDESGFVMDNIGRRGLQLFVDAGQAVDNRLVNDLVKEVLQEKIRSMLGQRPGQEETTPLIPGATDTVIHDESEGPMQPLAKPEPVLVSTPEPTPRASPGSSPPRRMSPTVTPPATPQQTPRQIQTQDIPMMSQAVPEVLPEPESEPESYSSVDINEELQKLAAKLKMAPQSSVESQHDVMTPPSSPKPEPYVQEEEDYTPITSPEATPREETEPTPRLPPAPVVKEEPKPIMEERATSPILPQTPRGEEEEKDVEQDQPPPVLISTRAAEREALPSYEPERKSRSPSPARKSRSQTPSESSYTDSSSVSDTFNENISEGQWLMSKSEGEVADFPIDDVAVRQRLMRSTQKKVDVSSASTWKDIDDVDLDDATDVSRSEGEFLYKTPVMPENDPVLDLLSRLHSSTPQYGQYPMSSRQVSNVLNTSGKSTGEITPFGVSGRSEGEVTMGGNQQRERRMIDEPTRQTVAPIQVQSQPRPVSPVRRTASPTRVSFEDQRSASPTRGILKQTNGVDRSGRRGDINEPPVRDRQSPGPTNRLTPGGRQPMGRGPTISAGGRASPGKSSMRRPPQVVKSATLPSNFGTAPRLVQVRSSSEDFKDSLENTGGASYYSSDMGTRTMTPDQMNLDPLIQSGYLSQSFSQSENGKFSTGGSSLRSSMDYAPKGQGQKKSGERGKSLGFSYESEGSITESELRRLAESGTLRMSVTLPEAFEEESDLSEIDITDGGNTGP